MVTSVHEKGNLDLADIPKIYESRAPGTLRHHAFASSHSELKRRSTVTLPDLSSSSPAQRKTEHADCEKQKAHLSWQDYHEYDDIIILDTNPSYSPSSTLARKSNRGDSSTVNPQVVSTETSQEEPDGIQMKSPADHIQSTRYRSPSHHSSESSTDVSKRLSHLLNPDQMEYLIDMLIQGKNSLAPEQESTPAGTTPPLRPPKPAQQHSATPEFSSLLAKFQKHPSQMSLSTGVESDLLIKLAGIRINLQCPLFFYS